MAFTREELQAYIDDRIDSPTAYSCGTVRELCRALLAEMDKHKDDIWKGAPKEAIQAVVKFYGCMTEDSLFTHLYDRTYTRELPKSRAREIAKEVIEGCRFPKSSMAAIFDGNALADLIESAILKREKELEAGK